MKHSVGHMFKTLQISLSFADATKNYNVPNVTYFYSDSALN